MLPLVVVGPRAVLGTGPDAVVGPVDEVARVLRDRVAADPMTRVAVTSAGDARAVLAPVPATPSRVDRVWDLAEAHRMAYGGWLAPPGVVWAGVRGLDATTVPRPPTGDLFDFEEEVRSTGDPDSPVRDDGHLRGDAFAPSWCTSDVRLVALASCVDELARAQREALQENGSHAVAAVHAESAAALLCIELERDGLPVDRAVAERLIADAAGPRPVDEADARRIRAERDAVVLAHAPGRERADLRNPGQVRDLLLGVGVDVPDTRAWSLEPFRATHPLVDALLTWRKAERIATTYGYGWLDTHVGPDDRLRGGWTACDGAAGRMTAQNGLHNLPAPLRPAVAAESGHVLVRADLGQIEPRVLAAVSGDPAFADATRADDLYAPVAARLGIERPVAKIAVLAAMYGQRSGAAGEALQGLERAYPTAMGLLDEAYAAGVAARPLRTYGGRRINLDTAISGQDPAARVASDPRATARGRFARNAVIQGAAAELFKAWAATVRVVTWDLGARIVLCLHDELLVHAPQQHADEVVARMHRALDDAARRWTGDNRVRFVADVSVVHRWSEAKD